MLPFGALGVFALASPTAIILHDRDVSDVIAVVISSDGPQPAGTGADLRRDPALPPP